MEEVHHIDALGVLRVLLVPDVGGQPECVVQVEDELLVRDSAGWASQLLLVSVFVVDFRPEWRIEQFRDGLVLSSGRESRRVGILKPVSRRPAEEPELVVVHPQGGRLGCVPPIRGHSSGEDQAGIGALGVAWVPSSDATSQSCCCVGFLSVLEVHTGSLEEVEVGHEVLEVGLAVSVAAGEVHTPGYLLGRAEGVLETVVLAGEVLLHCVLFHVGVPQVAQLSLHLVVQGGLANVCGMDEAVERLCPEGVFLGSSEFAWVVWPPGVLPPR